MELSLIKFLTWMLSPVIFLWVTFYFYSKYKKNKKDKKEEIDKIEEKKEIDKIDNKTL